MEDKNTNSGVIAVKRWIEIPFMKEGRHMYPNADKDPKLATGEWDDVGFLGTEHFHYFHFKVRIEVFHNDRDLEFIQFRRWCERLYDAGTLECGHRSCEMLAEELHAKIEEKWPGRDMVISVYEDNINGAVLEFMHV